MSKYDASIDTILDIEINNIAAVKRSLDREVMARVIDLMLNVKPSGHKVITAGCGTDAPGSYIAWLSTQTPVHAMEMPGHRYDIGNLESYHTVCEQYDGIQPTATK